MAKTEEVVRERVAVRRVMNFILANKKNVGLRIGLKKF